MMRLLFVIASTLLFSGCTAGSAEPIAALEERSLVAPRPIVAPSDVTAFDGPWASDEMERSLFEGTVMADLCGNAAEATADEPTVNEGCASFVLDEPIPAGTRAIRVEADATGALKSGSFYAYFYTAVRRFATEADGEPSSSAKNAWRWELDPREWDDASATESAARLGFWTRGGGMVNVLNGPINVEVFAERDSEWVPTRALPPMVLLDVNETWAQGSGIDMYAGTGTFSRRVMFAPIPDDAVEISLLLSWTTRDCPPGHDCSPNPTMYHANTAVPALEVERTKTTVVRRVMVPESVQPDLPDALVSATTFTNFVWRCEEGGINPVPCFAAFYAHGVSIDVHAVVLAWFTPFDLATAKEKAGMAT